MREIPPEPSCILRHFPSYSRLDIMMDRSPPPAREVRWVGSSLRDLRRMPESVRDAFGTALRGVQFGEMGIGRRTLIHSIGPMNWISITEGRIIETNILK